MIVDYFGEEKKAINEFYDIGVGDYICAQGGYVIKKVPPREAEDTLTAWRELFFQLRDIDRRLSRVDFNKENISRRLTSVLDKALEEVPLNKEELLYLLSLNDPAELRLLFRAANFLRQKYHQNSCCVHGIVEISNFCARDCLYCGIASANPDIIRYRMSQEEIIKVCVEAQEVYGFQALVLQSGEDPGRSIDELADLIKKIKARIPVLVCISFGEVGPAAREKLYRAGARGLLLRFETSNPKNYARLHPGQTLKARLKEIEQAKEQGYLIMTGGLIGLPGQSKEDIINDLYLTKALGAEMYSFGPFLPHPRTPLGTAKPPSREEVLKVLALARFIDPRKAKILITTALETLDVAARREGLLGGANSLMLNVTPLEYRREYAIYPERAYSREAIGVQIDQTIRLLKSLGRAPTDLGVS